MSTASWLFWTALRKWGEVKTGSAITAAALAGVIGGCESSQGIKLNEANLRWECEQLAIDNRTLGAIQVSGGSWAFPTTGPGPRVFVTTNDFAVKCILPLWWQWASPAKDGESILAFEGGRLVLRGTESLEVRASLEIEDVSEWSGEYEGVHCGAGNGWFLVDKRLGKWWRISDPPMRVTSRGELSIGQVAGCGVDWGAESVVCVGADGVVKAMRICDMAEVYQGQLSSPIRSGGVAVGKGYAWCVALNGDCVAIDLRGMAKRRLEKKSEGVRLAIGLSRSGELLAVVEIGSKRGEVWPVTCRVFDVRDYEVLKVGEMSLELPGAPDAVAINEGDPMLVLLIGKPTVVVRGTAP